jgi:hypothetical protein
MDNAKIGNIIRLLGWAVVAFYVIRYGYGTFDTLSDASVSVYAPLVALEGAVHVAGGLILVWVGSRIRKNAAKAETRAE